MLTKEQAKVDAWLAIADLIGKDYFRTHFEGSCHSYPDDKYDDIEYEYFIGFDNADDTNETDNKWQVFARVSVNRETEKVTFLDYKTPDGKRMENPIKPVRSA